MTKFYSTNKIDKKNAVYNVIFGERSNGKTYALLLKGLKNFIKTGEQLAYLRRWKEDIVGKRGSAIFEAINANGEVSKLTGEAFSHVHYLAGKFYLANHDENGKVIFSDFNCLGFLFALSDSEHNKSASYPNVTTIIFDEFLSSRLYLPDEFILFMNTLSTIIRRRENVKIYMLGNTVNKFNPYFQEMGLNNALKMKQGTIDVYKYGEGSLTVAVEYCATILDKESVDSKQKYFAFNNPKLEMITGGKWELDIYPHLPFKYKNSEIIFTFFIEFNSDLFQCEVIQSNESIFIFIHNKTTPLKNNDDLLFTLTPSHLPNRHLNVLKPIPHIGSKIASLFTSGKVFYQSNDVGNSISNYLKLLR